MTRAGEKAYRLRWAILVAAVLCLAAGVWFFINPMLYPGGNDRAWAGPAGTPLVPAMDHIDQYQYYCWFFGLFLLTQYLFLLPRGDWALRLTRRGRPMLLSVAIGAFMGMLLSVGLIATALEIPDLWAHHFAIVDKGSPAFGYGWMLLIAAGIWAAWGGVFYVYARSADQYTRLARLIRGLIAGSILEMLVAAPVQALVVPKRECYCARGSYTGLVFGGTVLCWAFGPGIVLLFMREKYRRQTLLTPCPGCGYSLRGTIDARGKACPECGTPIQSPYQEPHA